jgi:hypothetical protein
MFDSMEACMREIMGPIIHRIQYYGGGAIKTLIQSC